MKKFMLFAAMASVVLTSCVNEDMEVMESASKKAISFDMPVMKPTRAAGEIDGTTYPTGETFKVFCKSYTGDYAGWAGTDYFASVGEDVAFNGSEWSTATVHYWPELGNKLAFAAYSPAAASADGTFAQTNTGLTITGFSTQDDVANQYDLMYTPRVIDLDKNSAGADVPLAFKHALTSVVFKATKTDADATYTIKSLTVNGKVSTTGDFNQNIPTSAALDGTATWAPEAATDMTYSILSGKAIDVAQAGTALTGVGSTDGASTALLLIPQGVDANTTVTITYTKTTGGNSLDATATINLVDFLDGTSAPVTAWAMGHRYIYNIIFGANKPIYFNPSVTDWTDVTLDYTIE